MANRLSKEKACAIAAEYCTNKFQKVKALLSVGYSETYANNIGLKLFDNDIVKQAIAKIQAVAVVTTGYTIGQAQAEYEEARSLSMQLGQPAAAATAVTGKARLHGFDKDVQQVDDTLEPLNHSPELLQILNTAINDYNLRPKRDGPKLHNTG